MLSVGHTLPGLYCIGALRDLGAEVIRIERVVPEDGLDPGPYAALAGRFTTRSLLAGTSQCRLDLRDPRGADAFRRMAARCQVVLEGFRPGVARRRGIDYEALAADHPALVYASISGYGQEGADRLRVGHDLNYLAETGVLSLSNPPGLPGATFADGLAGVSGALNIVAALLAATRTGAGQHLDLAIVDGPLFLLTSELEHHWRTGESRRGGDTHLTGRYPWYGLHETVDGGRVAVGAVEGHFHAALCRGLGLPELESRQYCEGEELEDARARVAEAFASRTREEGEALSGADACVSAVLDVGEVAASARAQRAFRRDGTGGETLVRSPVRLGPAPLGPERGSSHVLRDLGFAPEGIEALCEARVAGSD